MPEHRGPSRVPSLPLVASTFEKKKLVLSAEEVEGLRRAVFVLGVRRGGHELNLSGDAIASLLCGRGHESTVLMLRQSLPRVLAEIEAWKQRGGKSA